MESYFFTISVNDSMTEDKIIAFFRQNYRVKPYSRPSGSFIKRRVIDDKRFVIDDKAAVDILSSDKAINITFELCFANYTSNMEYIFDVVKNIFSLQNNAYLVLLGEKFDFNLLDFDTFKQLLQKSHKEKLNIFNGKYGIINCDILPHDFYDHIRKIKS